MYELPTKEETNSFKKTSGILGAFASFVFESIEAIVIALAICVILYLFLITPHEVFGRSMYPNFKDGEYLIANKIAYRVSEPERGDVIIFKHSPTQDYIKRVIALPGDTVSIQSGDFYVNDQMLDEAQYIQNEFTNGGAFLGEGEDYTVKEGEIFVAGDNRDESSDSRAFGPIKVEDIKGKVWFVYFPFSEFRFIEHQNYTL